MLRITRVKQGLVFINPDQITHIERGADIGTTRINFVGGTFITAEGTPDDIGQRIEEWQGVTA